MLSENKDNKQNHTSKVHFISCGIYQPELEHVLDQIRNEKLFDCEMQVTYLGAGLHTNFNLLKSNVLKTIDSAEGDRIILLYGSKCHPEFDELLKNYPLVRFPQPNCIEIILEQRVRENKENLKTFYLTPGWITKWREIFDSGWGLDEVMMRQSFGFYDRLLLADTGVCEITDEQILEFFEYVGVPVEIENTGLENFKNSIVTAIKKAIELENEVKT